MQIAKCRMKNDESEKSQKKRGTVILNLVLNSFQY
jgi:hypothetical protein